MKILINKSLALIGLELRRKPQSALDVQRTLCPKLRPVIFDVGANIGQTAIEYRRLFPGGKIYAFEPFPDSYLALRRFFAKDTNMTISNIALSDHSGEGKLFSNNAHVTNSLLETSKDGEQFWGDIVRTKNAVCVRVGMLDDFCNIHRIREIDILKIDTQGTELSVLRGAHELLKRKAINLLYFEIIIAPTYKEQTRVDECFSFLYSLGYRLVDIHNLWKKGNELLQMDVLFAKG